MPELFFQCKIDIWLSAQVLKPCALPLCDVFIPGLMSIFVIFVN